MDYVGLHSGITSEKECADQCKPQEGCTGFMWLRDAVLKCLTVDVEDVSTMTDSSGRDLYMLVHCEDKGKTLCDSIFFVRVYNRFKEDSFITHMYTF